MPVEWLRELVGGAEVCWIGLNPAQSVDTVAGVPIVPLARECPDFLATSALVSALDLVITVDTAVAHLAGAVAVPCWVLLAANSDWRWLRGRHDSPWYPSLRLFRQSTLGDWGTVVLDVRTELEQRFSLSLTHVHETL
jgi:ADP-heptose:LPS heptosyltransferase